MRNTLINALHENNRYKRAVATWEMFEKLSASVECLGLDQEKHDSLIRMLKDVIEAVEVASFSKGRGVAEKEYNEDLRILIRTFDDPDVQNFVKECLESE